MGGEMLYKGLIAKITLISRHQAYSCRKKFSRLWPILQVQERFPDALRTAQRLPFAATNLFGTRR